MSAKPASKNRYWTLFLTFLKIGAFTFGGGYAMIPLIHREIVDEHKWITNDDLLDLFAIAEATPGVIAVNTATSVGYRVGGVLGSTLATLGVILPSFIIISIISLFFEAFKSLKIVAYAFEGIRAGVIVLILGAVKKFGKAMPKDLFNWIVLGIAFLVASFTGVNTVFVVLAGFAIGIIYSLIMRKISKKSAGSSDTNKKEDA